MPRSSAWWQQEGLHQGLEQEKELHVLMIKECKIKKGDQKISDPDKASGFWGIIGMFSLGKRIVC
jgi:hypothetical protein